MKSKKRKVWSEFLFAEFERRCYNKHFSENILNFFTAKARRSQRKSKSFSLRLCGFF